MYNGFFVQRIPIVLCLFIYKHRIRRCTMMIIIIIIIISRAIVVHRRRGVGIYTRVVHIIIITYT